MLSCFRQSWLSIGSNQSLFERCSRFVFGTGTRSSFNEKNSGFAKMYSRLVCPSPVPQNAGSCYRWVCQSAVCLHSQKINFTKIFVKNDYTENSFFQSFKKISGLTTGNGSTKWWKMVISVCKPSYVRGFYLIDSDICEDTLFDCKLEVVDFWLGN